MAEKRVHKPLPQPWPASGVWGCLRTFSLTRRTVSLCVCSLRGQGLNSTTEISEDTSPSKKLQHNSEMRESRAKKQKRFVSSKSGILIILDLRPLCKQGENAVDCTKKCSISCLSAAGTFPHQLFWLLVLFSRPFLHLSVFFYLVTSLSTSNIKGLGMLFTRGNFNSDRNWLWTKYLCNSKGLRLISHGPWLQNWTQTNLNFRS